MELQLDRKISNRRAMSKAFTRIGKDIVMA